VPDRALHRFVLERTGRIPTNQQETGNRLRQKLVDEVTGDPVEGSDKDRGYEYAKHTYLMIEDEDLDAIAIESNHTIEIDSFVPRSEIDERYLDSP
jgi:DNA end-binding protein Ku